MFTWLQSIFQKYGKWMFLLLLAPVIVAFVFTITPARSGLSKADALRKIDYFGYNLASDRDLRTIFLGAEISAWIQSGRRPYSQEMLEDFAFNRTAYLAMAENLSVPGPNEKQLRDYLTTKRAFIDEDGKFNEQLYFIFKNAIQADSRISQERVAQTMNEDYRIEKVQQAMIGPGYVQSFEVKKQIELLNTLWSVNVASLSYEDYKPFILIEKSKLLNYYESNKFRYEVPAQIKVTAIVFSLIDFRDSIPAPQDSELESFFDSQPSRFDNDANSNEKNSEKELTFFDVKDKVREAYLDEKAGQLTAEAADEFTLRLYRDKIEKNSEDFNQLIVEKNGRKASIPLYSRTDPPTDTKISRQALIDTFNLNERRYFSDIIKTQDGSAVLIYDNRVEKYIPSFEEVRESILTDYEESERKRLFIEKGKTINSNLTTAMSQGKLFSAIAEGLDLSVETYKDFTRSEPPDGFKFSLFTPVENLSPGDVTPMLFIENNGFFVHLENKIVPEENSDFSVLESNSSQIVQATNYYSGQSLILELRSNELDKSQTN